MRSRLLYLALGLGLALTAHAQAPADPLPARPVQLAVATTPTPDFRLTTLGAPAPVATGFSTTAPRVDAVVTSPADARTMLRYLLDDNPAFTVPQAPQVLSARQFRQYLRRGRRYLYRYQKQRLRDEQRRRLAHPVPNRLDH